MRVLISCGVSRETVDSNRKMGDLRLGSMKKIGTSDLMLCPCGSHAVTLCGP
ncbi:uncharacterized protein DS421_5g146220 [Arachis hypogaea]|nr:uncharacterized protein DS421_5g146220 [Arachis hypogaea]